MNINVFGVHISISRGKSHPQTVSVPDFMQEGKEQALRFVPKGNTKEAFIMSRFSHIAGAMREFIRYHPEMRDHPDLTRQIVAASNLAHQVGVFELSKSYIKSEAYKEALTELVKPEYGLMPDVIKYIERVVKEHSHD